MNDIVNDKNDQNIVNNIMNEIVNDKRGHNIVDDSFAHKPDGLLEVPTCGADLYCSGERLHWAICRERSLYSTKCVEIHRNFSRKILETKKLRPLVNFQMNE